MPKMLTQWRMWGMFSFCGLGNMLWFLSFFCVANKGFFSQLSIVWCFVDELQRKRGGPHLSGCCNYSFKRLQVLFRQHWRIEDNQKPQSISSVIVYASELNYQKLLPAEFENPLLWRHCVSHTEVTVICTVKTIVNVRYLGLSEKCVSQYLRYN